MSPRQPTPKPALPGSTHTVDGAATPAALNAIHLIGRVATAPTERVLPSGDVIVTFRLVVARPIPRSTVRASTDGAGAERPRRPSVDTFEIACWTRLARRSATRLSVDCVAEITGSLRRRFFRTPGGPQSRYEIEAESVRLVAKP